MLEAIEQDLVFVTPDEKAEWMGEALNWRLPYWDWALPKSDIGIPTLFTTETIQIRVPKAADGTLPPPEVKDNPLYRYQLRVGKERTLTKMGDLPKPYKIDSVPVQDPNTGEIWFMPVCGSIFPLCGLADLTSGPIAQAQADGASRIQTKTGHQESTIGNKLMMPYKPTSTKIPIIKLITSIVTLSVTLCTGC
jgi:hypothetical protein